MPHYILYVRHLAVALVQRSFSLYENRSAINALAKSSKKTCTNTSTMVVDAQVINTGSKFNIRHPRMSARPGRICGLA